MRIAFLCGSLDPGRDGVGDYTRLLAAELVRQGHPCLLVAMNDRWLVQAGDETRVSLDVTSPDAGNRVGQLRLSPLISWTERMAQVQQVLADFHADVISLQFVPYAFQDKGLVGRFARHLLAMLRTPGTHASRFHVMCHELWLGGRSSLPVRQRLIGRIQRTAILNMLRELGPRTVVHTSNVHYRNRLKRGGIKYVRILPLFSNIPVSDMSDCDWLFSRLNEAGVHVSTETRSSFSVAGFFGSLQPADWSAEPLLGCLIRAAKRSGRRLVLLSAGRIGAAGAAEWDRIKCRYAGHITCVRLGEMEPRQLSQYLKSLDFGLASTRLSVVAKSGTVTAMLEHGLPVLCSHIDLPLAAGVGIEDDTRAQTLLIRSDEPNLEDRIAAGLPFLEPVSRLSETASMMLNDLRMGARAR